MYCPRCGKQNTENVKWCCFCGALMEAPEPAHVPPPVQAEPERPPVPPEVPPAGRRAPSNGGKRAQKTVPGRAPRRKKPVDKPKIFAIII